MNQDAQLYTLFDNQPYHIRDFLLELAQYYHRPKDLTFLDVGCGPGRLLLPMAQHGWRVTGLEPDPHYVASAKLLKQQSPNIIDVRQGGFADISAKDHYDLIVAINNPFLYLLTQADRLDALQRIVRALRAGGVIFIEFFNLLWHLRYYREPESARLPQADGTSIRRVTRYRFDWHNATMTHTDQFYRDVILLSTQSHKLAIIALPTVISLLEQVGFQRIMTFNNYSQVKPQAITGGRILISAQKPL